MTVVTMKYILTFITVKGYIGSCQYVRKIEVYSINIIAEASVVSPIRDKYPITIAAVCVTVL